MVAKGSGDRRSSSSTNTTKQRVTSATHEKKKIVKPIGICGFCLGDNEKNAKGVPEKMIHCAECGNSGHPSCLQYSDALIKKIRTIHWQCIDCKRCIVCNISDDSLLFCDYCDSGIHPKCCNPPLNTIPKGEFACYLCSDEIKISSPKKTFSTSPSRLHRSLNSNSDEIRNTSPSIIPQLIDSTSNFFLTNKQKSKINRKQSVQKAMKYLREKKTLKSSKKTLLKRLQSSKIDLHSNDLLGEDLLISSKTTRIKKNLIHDDLPSSPQTSTPLLKRQLSNKKLLPIEPITPPSNSRVSRRSDNQLNESTSTRSITKRKHSINSTSPISTTSSILMKKRVKQESPGRKSQGKSKRKESQTEEDQSDDDQHTKTNGSKRKLSLDLSKYKNVPAFLKDALPDDITENDVHLFLESRKNSTKLITDCSEKFHHSSECIDDDSTNTRWPPYIVFGSDLLKTWYSSSYPQEYARVPRLYICEFCLKYMKCEQVYDRHRKKCIAFHPPANEIYHKDDLSVFEVDGNINRIYCQNLCLLAKLFLDHKTLYYDVEPFLFYVLTRNDSNGCHFIGYFSKEKHCPQKYNLSCITVLPNCQRRGYGRFLIELSYLISKKEGQFGTPERPLSTLGAQTYDAYWKIKLVEQLIIYYNENNSKCLLKTIMNETGMAVDDIIETLQNLGVLTMKSTGKPVIIADVTQLENIIKKEKIKHAHWVSIDSEYLRFTPVLTPLLLTNEEKAVEKEVKEIQIVFKEIGREAAEAASLAAESADGTNPNESVRYIRRRKFGHKRRSIIVKRRTPIHNKSNKNDSILTNDDSCATDIITNDDDEHSQEYVSRRRISIIDETIKEEEKEKEEEEEENKNIPISSSPKVSVKPPIFKQLKLDQFLKIVNSTNDEKPQLNLDIKTEEINHDNDDIHSETRRITRNTRLHSTSKSESEPIKIENNNISIDTKPELTDENPSTEETTSSIDQQILLKPRPITPPVIDQPLSPSKNKPKELNREISVTSTNLSETPSSTLSEILANPLLTVINGTEDQTKIASIESQLKTTTMELITHEEKKDIKPVESTDDEIPPSLISPTTMIVSQSNHYNYSTRNKEPQQQQPPITNVNYNYDNTSYAYPSTSYNMESYYYPPTTQMNYMPYYPTSSTSTMYPPPMPMYSNTPDQQSYYPTSYNGNGTTPYVYPTTQSSSTASTTQRH